MTSAAAQGFWPLQRRASGLYAASALYGLTNGGLFPLIAIALAQSGVDEVRIGWIASAYYAGAFLAALTFAPVVRLIGYRLSMVLIAIVGAASAAAAILPLPLIGWIAVRMAFGYAAAGVYVDAGVGIEGWGITRLPALERRGIAGITVSAASARIGDARSVFDEGVISHVNARAAGLGAAPGQPLKPLLVAWAQRN